MHAQVGTICWPRTGLRQAIESAAIGHRANSTAIDIRAAAVGKRGASRATTPVADSSAVSTAGMHASEAGLRRSSTATAALHAAASALHATPAASAVHASASTSGTAASGTASGAAGFAFRNAKCPDGRSRQDHAKRSYLSCVHDRGSFCIYRDSGALASVPGPGGWRTRMYSAISG
jgi:hypothetical protein